MSVNSSNTRASMLVTNETLNFSKANAKFSFSKDPRFSLRLDRLKKTEFNYDLPSTLSARKTGFGYGDRFKTPSERGTQNSKWNCASSFLSSPA